MYCWSCGEYLPKAGMACEACGAGAAALPRATTGSAYRVRSCPGCGYTGDGIPYFRRAQHAALLVAATVFTYGMGGVAYWVIKRGDRICPSCGLSWERARLPRGEGGGNPDALVPAGRASPVEGRLPRTGIIRRVAGVLAGGFAVLLLGVSIVELEPVAAVFSGVTGLVGAASFAWGWHSLQQRREAILQRMQRRVLQLAWARRGRLTATEVAAEMDLSLSAAERVLLSMDDGFRVRTEVTDEGLLVFDFPEIRIQDGGEDPLRLGSAGVS